MTVNDVMHAVERLPRSEKWAVFRHLANLLEEDESMQGTPEDYQEFLRQTYGSLKDTPLQRYDPGDFDEREPIE